MFKNLYKKIFRLSNTIKYSKKSYSYLTTAFNLERKVDNNVELNDEEYFELKNYLDEVPNEKKFYVDIGCGNGVNGSCTLRLAKDDGWKGLAIDRGSPIYISYIYRNLKNITISQNTVTPNNVENIFKSYSLDSNFGFLNLDIDSYDYEVMKAILSSGYRPLIISAEINEVIPPPIEFYVRYDKVNNSELMVDHFFGCSLTAINKLLNSHNYNLIRVYRNNAFFVLRTFLKIEKKDELEAYVEGYFNLENRDDIFPYNIALNHIFKKSSDDKLNFFKKRFQQKESDYFLKVSESNDN